MTAAAQPEDDQRVEGLSGRFSREQISMALTTAGLLPQQTRILAQLYAEELSWEAASERWHQERRAGRGSRESAQKMLKLLRERLNAAGDDLPGLRQLAALLEQEPSVTARAQIVYFYLLNFDNLVRYVLHELLRDQGLDRREWNLSSDVLRGYVMSFRYEDGGPLDYAESTLVRWIQGFRSVLHDVGVRKGKYANDGEPPDLADTVLWVAAGYSWHAEGGTWDRAPLGWMYLFQPEATWPSLLRRLTRSAGWERVESPGGVELRPVGDPFDIGALSA